MVRDLMEKANNIPFWCILKMKQPDRDVQMKCPFKERHEHGDTHRSARYYIDTNRIWCFTESKMWSPVDLFTEKTGKSRYEVAKLLVTKYGDRTDFAVERIKYRIQKSEQNRPEIDSYIELEQSFDDCGVRRFVAERGEIANEGGLSLFKDTAETAMKLSAFIAEQGKENQDG